VIFRMMPVNFIRPMLHMPLFVAVFPGPLSPAMADIEVPPGDGWTIQPQVEVPPADAGESANPAAPVVAVEGPAPGGAVQAMLAIDPKYIDGIVLVTARGGKPVPPEWTVLARDSDDLGTLHKLTVADGQVIADVQSLNAYESFRQDVSINPTSVQVDSGRAFSIAEPIAAANNKVIGHVDYSLTIHGTDAAPIWTLNCFSVGGGFLGKVEMLATTGQVLRHPGFRNAPTP
jgi:hypothetical protein